MSEKQQTNEIVETLKATLKELLTEENVAIKIEIDYIKRDLTRLFDILDKNFVKREEFTPVRNLVYGVVSLILVAVFGALIGLVIIK